MNYINVLLAKINHFNSKMADPNYLDICSFYHSTIRALNFIFVSALGNTKVRMLCLLLADLHCTYALVSTAGRSLWYPGRSIIHQDKSCITANTELKNLHNYSTQTANKAV